MRDSHEGSFLYYPLGMSRMSHESQTFIFVFRVTKIFSRTFYKMPYRRRSYRRPTGYRRRRTGYGRRRRGGSGWMSTASRALYLATKVAGIVNSELKHYDESQTLNPDNSTGAVVSIVRGMAQGDTNNTFEGNSILAKRLNCRINLGLGASATATKVRIAIVWDTRPSTTLATIPAWTDVFSAASTNAMMNIDDQLNRFRIMHDKTYMLTTNYPEKQIVINKSFSRHIKFTDAQVPNLNDIILLTFSDEATNVPGVLCQSRLRFYDN